VPQLRVRGCRGVFGRSGVEFDGAAAVGLVAGAPPQPRAAGGQWAGSEEADASTSAERKKETRCAKEGGAAEGKKLSGGDAKEETPQGKRQGCALLQSRDRGGGGVLCNNIVEK
jgi:hypothetical protein